MSKYQNIEKNTPPSDIPARGEAHDTLNANPCKYLVNSPLPKFTAATMFQPCPRANPAKYFEGAFTFGGNDVLEDETLKKPIFSIGTMPAP